MLALRFYIDKKIVDGEGGEHSRVIDVADMPQEDAAALVESRLEEDEVINQMVTLTVNDDYGPLVTE